MKEFNLNDLAPQMARQFGTNVETESKRLEHLNDLIVEAANEGNNLVCRERVFENPNDLQEAKDGTSLENAADGNTQSRPGPEEVAPKTDNVVEETPTTEKVVENGAGCQTAENVKPSPTQEAPLPHHTSGTGPA